jgi:hypothetical protein
VLVLSAAVLQKKEHKLYGAHFNPNLDLSKKASKITFDD